MRCEVYGRKAIRRFVLQLEYFDCTHNIFHSLANLQGLFETQTFYQVELIKILTENVKILPMPVFLAIVSRDFSEVPTMYGSSSKILIKIYLVLKMITCC